MKELIQEDIYKTIDKQRIWKALANGNRKDALTLFKYSSLSGDEFFEMEQKQSSTCSNENIVSENNNLERATFSENLWDEILELIAERISVPSFDTWIKHTIGEFIDDTVVIHTNNEFQRDWLENQYKDLFTSITEKVTGKSYKVVFLNKDEDKYKDKENNSKNRIVSL